MCHKILAALSLPQLLFLATAVATGPEPTSNAEKKLDGFATVDEAKSTSIKFGPNSDKKQPAYLGLMVERRDGKVVIEEVAVNSPAAEARFVRGDVLLNAGKVDVKFRAELSDVIAKHAPGDNLEFVILRDKKQLTLKAILDPISQPMSRATRGRTSRRGVLGVQVEPSEDPRGARVQSVFDGSGADQAGVKAGDVITKLEGQEITKSISLVQFLVRTKPGDIVKLVVQRDDEELKLEAELGSTFGSSISRSRSQNRKYSEGSYRLAIIGVEYPDQKHNKNVKTKDWEASLFSTGEYTGRSATGQRVYGSMNDYYRELSAAKFGVEGKFFDWVEVSKNRTDYMRGNRSALMVEAMDLILKRDGNDALKEYDGVFFLYAGNRVRTERGGLYWPHRGSLTHKRKRWSYFIMQEGGQRMSDISVMCHEFGHMLGLPDLYSKDARAEGLGVWCAMSNQAGGGRPQHFSAWCKEQLGWLKPTVIDPREKQKLILGPVERSAKECFKVLIKQDGSEYLLLENRRQFGFDSSLPSQGLLIWRVSGNRPTLVESHGIAGPAGPSSFRDVVPFPSKSNNSYTPRTTPSSKSIDEDGWPVHITNIQQLADGRISFYVGYEFQ